MSEKVYVYENFSSKEPTFLGLLFIDKLRGKECCSFEYDPAWLTDSNNNNNVILDPNIGFYEGRQYPPTEITNFGMFSDSSPDRWGETLMRRRERIRAKQEGRKPNTLLSTDYLLGVYDKTRMGALRFKLDKNGPFLSDDMATPLPPWSSLRTLEEAARNFEHDSNGFGTQWLSQLIMPGSSLGGARPKATVTDIAGNLWIAKFPSKHDDVDCGAWEKVTHDLARMCGLSVAESMAMRFSQHGSTFLTRRFDRDSKRRVHFASAMTMLGKTDGASSADEISYLDIASFIRAHGAAPEECLAELWKRIIFNMAVSNTDDHLRNHGFILSREGWRLSPAYDVNPVPQGAELSLCVSVNDPSISISLGVETAKYYGIDKGTASRLSGEILRIVKENWVSLAAKYGIKRDEQEIMRPAFSLL